MPKTRIGIFTADFHPAVGGIGVVTFDLYRGLEHDAEFEPVVFSPARNELANHHRLPAVDSRLWLPISFSLAVNAVLEQLIRRHDLDLLHFMGSSGGVQLLRRPSKPALLTLHNTYHYLYRQDPGLVFRAMREAERLSLRNSTLVIPVSHGVRAELPQDLATDVEVIQNGIDTAHFYPRPGPKRPYFLFIGRLTRRKGVFDLIEAFARAELPQFELHLAGAGPQEELLAAAERCGVAARVRLLGHVSAERLPELYSQAHAVLLPSWSEGFPLCVAEAMACGAMFIGTRIPGIIEQVEEGVTGLLCPPRDPLALARCLHDVASAAPEWLEAMRARAALAGRAHSNERMIDSYRATYRRALPH